MIGSKAPNAREKVFMSKVADLGCIVCKEEMSVFSPAAIHHIVEGGKRRGHEFVLPLCYLHHQGGKNVHEYVSRHPFKKEFERRYGSEYKLLAKVRALICED